MDDFETEVPEIVFEGLSVNNIPKDSKELLLKRLKWLVFSDTIFVAMPLDRTTNTDGLKFDLIFFGTLAAYINRRMFEIGLPVRGAIHVGDVILSKKCFAGKAVVDAHKLAQRCQIAGTIVSQDAYNYIFNVFAEPKGFHFLFAHLIVECDVPVGVSQVSESLVSVSSEKMKTLCWFYLQLPHIRRFDVPLDFNRFVAEKFTEHGKKLSGVKECLKAVNTEKLFKDWQTTSRAQGEHFLNLKNATA